MLNRLRAAWQPKWKKPLWMAGLLLGAYVAGGFLLAPIVLKWAAQRYVTQTLHHQLSMDKPKINPLTLSVRLTNLRLAEPNGAPLLAFKELFVDYSMGSLLRWAYTFDALHLKEPQIDLELRADGSLNFSKLIEALNKDKKEETGLPRLLMHQLVLDKGRFNFTDRRVSPIYTASLVPLDLDLTELSTLPDDKGVYRLSARNLFGAEINWRGEVRLNPMALSGTFSLTGLNLTRFAPYLKDKMAVAPPEGRLSLSANYRAGYDKRQLALNLERLNIKLADLSLKGAADKEPTAALKSIELKDGRFNLQNQSIEVGELALQGGAFNLPRQVDGRWVMQGWIKAKEAAHSAAEQDPAANKPWLIQLKRCSLDGVRLHTIDQTFIAPLSTQIDNIKLDFGAEMAVGGAAPKFLVSNLGAQLAGVRVQSGAALTPILSLGELVLENGQVDLSAQKLSLGKIVLRQGKLDAVRDAQGNMALIDAWRMQPNPAQRKPVAAKTTTPSWQYAVDKIEFAGIEMRAKDLSTQPAAELMLEEINGELTGLNQNLKTPLPLNLAFKIKQGGRFKAQGRLVAATPSIDLKLKLDDVALAPAQPFLSQAANLQLASGALSTEGRLRYGQGSLKYDGGVSVRNLLLNEAGTKNRFLAWKSLTSKDVSLTHKGLDIGEIKLDGLGAKIIIAKDKSTNLQHVLTQRKPDVVVERADKKASNEAKPFLINLDRIRVQNGDLDFADLSLSLPFSTRIHKVRGAFNGISSRPGTQAQLELDGTVDEYGLARVAGHINMFNPTDATDLRVVFRNVEMTRLTPYTSTFAGYKIDSGKLSLDLEYKIKKRQLEGDNKIIMDQLILGERLEGPSIKHLPLGLAVALLKDADGKIDLGLPVSGSLDDPQFSYGQIVWKAISNIIVRIVTSPFRVLGALFGVGGDKLEQVSFDAGAAKLTPPEQEKIKLLAQAMNKRPGLALTVHGTYTPQVDRDALQERQLRREVATKMDATLAADEAPGPVTTSNAKVRAALESVYETRLGKDALRQFKANYRQVNPTKEFDSGMGKAISRLIEPKPQVSAAESAQLKDADFFELLYQRLRVSIVIPDADLQALAQARGERAVQALLAAGAPRARTSLGKPEKVETDGREVALKLELGVAPKVEGSTPKP